MKLTEQIANRMREVYFGENWIGANMKDQLADLTWQQAVTKFHSFNTIAALVYHTNYYICAVTKVLQGGPLDSHDKYSFDVPEIKSRNDWETLVEKTFSDANTFAELIEKLPDTKLFDDFWENKYGNYYKNLHGIIEHIHYHLGQVVLIKKMVAGSSAS